MKNYTMLQLAMMDTNAKYGILRNLISQRSALTDKTLELRWVDAHEYKLIEHRGTSSFLVFHTGNWEKAIIESIKFLNRHQKHGFTAFVD